MLSELILIVTPSGPASALSSWICEASGAPGCWHAGDLAWGLFLMSIRFDLAENVRLWQDEAGPVGGVRLVRSIGSFSADAGLGRVNTTRR